MRYIVDSDILIYFLKHHPQVTEKFERTDPDQIGTTIINHAELLFGAYNSAKVQQNLDNIKSFLESISIVNFDQNASETFAKLKTNLRKSGKVIADLDLMIASICLSNDFILVTNNTKHFGRIEELKIENWNI